MLSTYQCNGVTEWNNKSGYGTCIYPNKKVYLCDTLIRHATGVPLPPFRHSLLNNQVEYSYPWEILRLSKIRYPLMIWSPISSFLRILSTSFCMLFWIYTTLESSVYCNAQNIIHLYTLLVQITEFKFAPISCLGVNLILCTPPLVFYIFLKVSWYDIKDWYSVHHKSRVLHPPQPFKGSFRLCDSLGGSVNSYLGALDVHAIKTGAKGARIQITEYSRCVYISWKVKTTGHPIFHKYSCYHNNNNGDLYKTPKQNEFNRNSLS